MNRRDLFVLGAKVILAGFIGFIGLDFALGGNNTKRLVRFLKDEIKKGSNNDGVNYKDSVFLIDRDNKIEALNAHCTHLGCIVKWHNDKKEFICPCHGSVYDAWGNRVSGPAPRGLYHLKYKVEPTEIVVDYINKMA
ncbi:Rieske Fe-S protein [Desulfurella acetivorans A63]|nr:Rieske Fe-S protein [Desulfurella acetivorans A63]